MLIQAALQHNGATVALTATGYCSIMRVVGRISGDAVAPLVGAVAHAIGLAPPAAAVCDYSAAFLDVQPITIAAAMTEFGCTPDWPTALVVRPDAASTWRHYATMQSHSGLLRAVFTDMARAERWAAEQAALRQAQLRWFARAQSRR